MPDLNRFHDAQRPAYPTALAELRRGNKQSHWIWFILPQLKSLGRSPMARRYGIRDLEEARDYLADPILGPRLHDCVRAILAHTDKSAEEIMGHIDAMKLRSCATLFQAAGGGPEFQSILDMFYSGVPCEMTLAELAGPQV